MASPDHRGTTAGSLDGLMASHGGGVYSKEMANAIHSPLWRTNVVNPIGGIGKEPPKYASKFGREVNDAS